MKILEETIIKKYLSFNKDEAEVILEALARAQWEYEDDLEKGNYNDACQEQTIKIVTALPPIIAGTEEFLNA